MALITSDKVQKGVVGDMWRFGTVGVISTIIDFLFLNLFTYFGLNIYWAIFFAYLIGSINGYVFNNNWTYRRHGRSNSFAGFSQYASISFIGLALTEGIVYILSKTINLNISHKELINIYKLVAVVAVFFWNFFANRLVTFKGVGND